MSEKRTTIEIPDTCTWTGHWSDGRFFWRDCRNYDQPRYDHHDDQKVCFVCKRPIYFVRKP